MKINTKSEHLVVLLPTYNRLESLKTAIDSIQKNTACSHEIIVIDGGSTDGTIEYLKNRNDITSVFQGKLIGAARACNEVWKNIECKYTCGFADDEELLPGAFDKAIKILENDKNIGMVGLKMKDLHGPKKTYSFNGGMFGPGILCMSQSVCRMDLLKSIGFFDERFISYRADADLTASILCTGKNVVMTKELAILHHRAWSEDKQELLKLKKRSNIKESKNALRDKFEFLGITKNFFHRIKERGIILINKKIFRSQQRDWEVIAQSRFMKIYDPIIVINKPYYLVQKIPKKILLQKENPYQHLVGTV